MLTRPSAHGLLTALALTALLALPAPALGAILNTNDIPVDDPDRAAIEFLGRHEVIVGSPEDGTFRPNDLITRGEILKIVLEAAGQGHTALLSVGAIQSPFSDVDAAHTLRVYILYAQARGYIGGYGDGTFRPDAVVTRAEAAKIVSNVFVAPAALNPSPYADIRGSTLRDYVDRLHAANWFTVDGTRFEPNRSVQRREVARMAYRALVANAAAASGGGTRAYTPDLPEPDWAPSDWELVGDATGLRAMIPAGWAYESADEIVEGVPVSVLATGPVNGEDTVPVIAYANLELSSLSSFIPTDDATDPAALGIRQAWLNVSDGTSQRQAPFYLGYKAEERAHIAFWADASFLHMVLYYESALPGGYTLFLRSVQHAMELSSVADAT